MSVSVENKSELKKSISRYISQKKDPMNDIRAFFRFIQTSLSYIEPGGNTNVLSL